MHITFLNVLSTIGSFGVGTWGFYLLIRGKKTADPKKMILGGALMVASYWLFP
jgi:hypothetical protein